ncbi:hypothetical protein GTP46_04595 [Duganella sp. FT135W]|uniref:Uncharacterized protein n=1 Tax=Duganella flavida TaxID=2692175 RepID=A0A6L8K3Y5_9BURK|nr:hypothetical protein [Duganella flavida]MYM21930.1 hypothetical protein [Duganella flavida]
MIEVIDGDLASVRIYAAPEYGCWLENYSIHKKLAVNVPLRDLGNYCIDRGLQCVVDASLLATGDPTLAAEVRARHRTDISNFTHKREMGRVAA